jgi:predicted transcriptional regulator
MGSRVRVVDASVGAMNAEWDEVLAAALSMPVDERRRLVEALAESVGVVFLDAEEEAVVAAGLAEADRGEGVDGEEFFALLRQRHRAAAAR